MTDGITVHVLGDSGPFSRMGKSIGYLVTIGKSNYIIDCGDPLFQMVGGYRLRDINGFIITHCHDDHKRWFTDLAIFYKYATDIFHKLPLFTSESVHNDLQKSSLSALDRSLSDDSKKIIDIHYDDYIDYRAVGPRAKFKIVVRDEGDGKSSLCIVDSGGVLVGPGVAKIVVSSRTGRPRMLFRDPVYDEWVEPESFYPFSSNIFYEEEKNTCFGPEGFAIEAINAPVWHGIPTIGIKIRTANETLIFSSDTVHDLELWKQLYSKKRTQQLKILRKEFEAAPVIYGDINDFIERTWSEDRYTEAVNTFMNAVVIHDVAVRDPVVHTSYCRLKNTTLNKDKTMLTHSPDRITSEWVLSKINKKYKVTGEDVYEIVGNEVFPMNADIYHKEDGRFFVGYKAERGKYTVYSNSGNLSLSADDGAQTGTPLYNVDLYEDISGRYFPKLEDQNTVYRKRKDGKVELVETTEEGSSGKIVADCRTELLQRVKNKEKKPSAAGSGL